MENDEDPIVAIESGRIRGKTAIHINNGTFYSFQGIPYAKPPIGHLRFQAPQPPDPWTHILDATCEGSDCIQRYPVVKILKGGEDCLTLNVYTPILPKHPKQNATLPVMVWIHGGGFVSGSGSTEQYGPEFFMTEDVVLVTINYRLGILGFLSLEDPDLNIPGNAGLKDMVMALKWVQKNINNFSGDPQNVTVFGESAGAVASHYLILSPTTKGLFHRAILQSGCALNVWAKGRKCAKQLGAILGLQTTDEKKILAVLQELPVEELFEAAEKIPDVSISKNPSIENIVEVPQPFLVSEVRPYGPVIERKHQNAFLSDDPLDIIKSGEYNQIPIILGYTNREGMLTEVFQKPNPFTPLTDFELAIPHYLKLQRGSDISKLVASEIKKFYYGTEEPSVNNKDAAYLLETDNLFVREILLTARYHCETSSSPVYLYRMSIESRLNMLKNIFEITEPGVCHADDLGYLFKNSFTPEIATGSVEDMAVKKFVKLWTNFAKEGNPNPKDKNALIDVQWKPVTPNEMNFLDIGEKLTEGINPEKERMSFWSEILKINPVHKL